MRPPTRPRAPSVRSSVRHMALASLAIALAACGATGPSTTTAPSAAPSPSPVTQASDPASAMPSITPVPGGQTIAPPPSIRISTTQTDWGEILDVLPDTFPIHPGAKPTDADEPASGAFVLPGTVDSAATWYEDALTQLGFAVDLASALEDGSRVLDAQGDLPECRIQMTFRPEADSAIITVLYAAGCAAAG